MGMMIDKHIKILEQYDKGFSGYAGNFQETINFAIDTMRKYQKILEIFDMYDKGELTHDMFGLFVGKVLEDGKIDR